MALKYFKNLRLHFVHSTQINLFMDGKLSKNLGWKCRKFFSAETEIHKIDPSSRSCDRVSSGIVDNRSVTEFKDPRGSGEGSA
jgi:hypothetical protein